MKARWGSAHLLKKKQSGMALLIVLWVVAGLALFVVSLGQTVRSEAGQVGVAKRLLEGRAAGEAAIYLALAQQLETKNTNNIYMQTSVSWQGTEIGIELLPASGLVNMLSANKSQWAMLLTKAAGLARAQAEQLADQIVAHRSELSTQNAAWEAAEDLLQVPGVNYFVYESIRPYIIVQRGGQLGFNAQAAPAALRDWAAEMGLPSSSNNAASNHWRATAIVPFDLEGQVYVVREILVNPRESKRALWTVLSAREYWSSER